MNKRGKNNRGQMNLSFGMIFSLILIIVFIGFGFYAIKTFLNMQNEVKTEQFMSDLQEDVDKMWRGSQGNQEVSYILPTKIKSVCFQNSTSENLRLVSEYALDGIMIQHLDLLETLAGEDSLCIPNLNGKVKFKLVKDFGEILVKIEK